MKRIILALLVLVMSFTLVACKTDNKPEEEIQETPLVPETPKEEETTETPEEEEEEATETLEDTVTLYESSGEKGIWKTITIDTENYNKMKITIKGESAFDIPVNINRFKINGTAVEYMEVTGTRYLLDHVFKIGDFKAIGNLINTHKFEDVVALRLHTFHKDHGTDGYIIINLEEVNSVEFSFTVTTDAFAYLDGLQIELMNS